MFRLDASKEAHTRASKIIVGGVNSPVRSFNRVGKHPVFASHAQGPYVWDLDGNKYLDFVLSYGPHLMGHAHPAIVESVQRQLGRGFCFGLSTPAETSWAQKLLEFFPAAERVRAMSTGTEACMTAIRLARGFTGRDLILKFSGHYHGHVDSLMVDSGSGIATLSGAAKPDSAGLPKGTADSVRVLPFNDEKALKDFFDQEGSLLAGVILEPVMGNMGVVLPNPDWLKSLEMLCKKTGSLLIFDEVMTGFRASRLSAQGAFGVDPDLTCLGKVVGGGFPVSALIGKAAIMDHLAPLGGVYQAGTLSGNPVGIAAGQAMLELLKTEDPFLVLEQDGQRVENVFREAIRESAVPACVVRQGTMFSVFFRTEAPQDAAQTRDIHQELFVKYFWAMLEQGFMIPPSPFEACFLSAAHHKELGDEFEEKIHRVFRSLSA